MGAPLSKDRSYRIVVAPDSFKGSLPASDVARAFIRGMKATFPRADYISVPMADGGEGTVQALVDATGGKVIPVDVRGPIGKRLTAFYGVLGDGSTAVIEMAAASGLTLVPEAERNPLVASTYGTGELIRAALDANCQRIILGIGGSATNDGGAGMAEALGVRFLDDQGEPIPPGGAGLERLHRIDMEGLDPRLAHVDIVVASDVDNPLCGPEGASYVFGPQKGADPDMVKRLDQALRHFARLIERDVGVDVAHRPGAGAAGGMGAGAMAFLGASLRSGVDIVIEAVGLAEKVAGADLVVTGEGQLDGQTGRGKTPAGVARLAQEAGVPVIGIAGGLGPGADGALRALGFTALLSIVDGPMDLETAVRRADELTERTGRTVGALLSLRAGRRN